MRKVCSLVLSIVLIVSVMALPAFAARTTVRITGNSTTVRVDRSIQLDYRISPDDADYDSVQWYSEDDRIAEVDDNGEVYGNRAGKVTISVRVLDDNGKRIASATREITVTDGSSVRNNDDDDTASSVNRTTTSTTTTTRTTTPATTTQRTTASVNTGGTLPSATVLDAVQRNVSRGQSTTATFRGYNSVSATSLKTAAAEMKKTGGTVLLNFDTINGANTSSVEGRVTINPADAANLSGTINLGVYTNSDDTGSTRSKFEKFFTNRVVVIKSDQNGSFGLNASFAVKIGTTLSTSKQLMLYSYDPNTNKANLIKDSNIWLDSNGYVHFTTNLGNYLVISDGSLVLR